MKALKINSYSKFRFQKPEDVDGISEDVLLGVILCEEGEALGHGIYIDKNFLNKVVDLAGKEPLKVRLDHPDSGGVGQVLSIVGEATNLRMDTVLRDGKEIPAVRGDIKLFNGSSKDDILILAKEASNHFGMSLDIELKGKKTKNGFEIFGEKMANGLIKAVPIGLTAVDFVEEAAATRSLFSAAVDSKEFNETMKLSKENQKKYGLPEIVTVEQLNEKLSNIKLAEEAEPTTEDRMAKLAEHFEQHEEMGKHFKAILDAYDATKEDEKKDEEVDKEKLAQDKGEDETKLSKAQEDFIKLAVVKQVTTLLSNAGVKARVSAPELEKKDATVELSESEKSTCKERGISESALLHANKTVGKLNAAEVEFCEKNGIDQINYKLNIAKTGVARLSV